ncbi:hypothetical protein IFM89_028344 [Coptis chinensis]|uniref:Cupin type-1 domain-containing protein n=1 Tax=Coptis chinensis TaxID=261450 RepID=A0A835IGK4_9MAGN|nr:hypothetical protein IFM89_028344 [Coptis chinensis]
MLIRVTTQTKQSINTMGYAIFVAFTLLAFASFVLASDPSPLQDFCVAINETTDGVFVNGKFCKDPKLATANDFFFSGLHMLGNTSNQLSSAVTPTNVAQIPGLNTLGISLARVDFAPYAIAFSGLSSQNPGVITIANSVFGSNPPISDDVLAKAFQLDKNVVDNLQAKFWMDIA